MLLRLNNLNHEMQNSMLERMELEKRKTEAQILVLQTQINPHFLHNILATTIMLIKMGQNIRAVDILQATGKFFRTSIYSDKTIVTVREELEHVWAYINLQMIRFPDKINFITADDEEVLPLLMPKFVLQPIVENAIDHNAKSNKAITIGIKFKLEQNFVIIVYDNGIGMNREVLTETQDRIDKNIYSGHVGLVNINKRLQLCFGPAYGIKIESIENKGTSVFITIPRDV
jgi:two-component system sensor histidine kinase YesM